MITIAILLLTIYCIIISVGIYKLQQRVKVLHDETNKRVSSYHIDIDKKLQKEIDELKELLSSNKSIITALQINTDKRFDDVVSKIPPTNERLLKEVQQMRDDFLALRQNL